MSLAVFIVFLYTVIIGFVTFRWVLSYCDAVSWFVRLSQEGVHPPELADHPDHSHLCSLHVLSDHQGVCYRKVRMSCLIYDQVLRIWSYIISCGSSSSAFITSSMFTQEWAVRVNSASSICVIFSDANKYVRKSPISVLCSFKETELILLYHSVIVFLQILDLLYHYAAHSD